MPGQQPYLALSREQINRLAKEAWTDPSTLSHLVNELESRKGPEPDSLLFKLTQRIAEIEKSAGGLSPSRSPVAAPPRQDSRPALIEQVNRLETELSRAREQAVNLEIELAAARQRIGMLERQREIRASGRGVYARVGLDEGCPDFVLAAVRTAYRKRFHPDRHTGTAKKAAEARFKEAEAVFDQLARLREAEEVS